MDNLDSNVLSQMEPIRRSADEDHARRARKMHLHRGGNAERATPLHDDRVASRDTDDVDHTMHCGWSRTTEGYHVLGGQLVSTRKIAEPGCR